MASLLVYLVYQRLSSSIFELGFVLYQQGKPVVRKRLSNLYLIFQTNSLVFRLFQYGVRQHSQNLKKCADFSSLSSVRVLPPSHCWALVVPSPFAWGRKAARAGQGLCAQSGASQLQVWHQKQNATSLYWYLILHSLLFNFSLLVRGKLIWAS